MATTDIASRDTGVTLHNEMRMCNFSFISFFGSRRMGDPFPIHIGGIVRVFLVYPHRAAIKCWKSLSERFGDHIRVKLRVVIPQAYDNGDRKSLAYELRDYRPDIIVLSDVAGVPYQISDLDIAALIEYYETMPWTRWLASYASFYYQSVDNRYIYDNRGLCSIFGLDRTAIFHIAHRRNITEIVESPSTVYIDSDSDFTYSPTVEHQKSLLWSGIQLPALASGFEASVIPEGGWFHDGLLSCAAPGSDIQVMAKGANDCLVILHNLTRSSRSLYLSFMPDQYGSKSFLFICYLSSNTLHNSMTEHHEQLIINALDFLMQPPPTLFKICEEVSMKLYMAKLKEIWQGNFDINTLPEELRDRIDAYDAYLHIGIYNC